MHISPIHSLPLDKIEKEWRGNVNEREQRRTKGGRGDKRARERGRLLLLGHGGRERENGEEEKKIRERQRTVDKGKSDGKSKRTAGQSISLIKEKDCSS